MKKVHVFAGNDELRPAFNYVQFKNGYFYATDAHIAGKFCADVVFDIEGMPDEFYILAKDFKSMCAVNPLGFELRDGVISVIGKKSNFLCPFLTAEQFANKVGRFPDVDSILPSVDRLTGTVTNFAFNAKLVSRIAEGFGVESLLFMSRDNQPAGFYVTPIQSESLNMFALIMPLYFNDSTVTEAKDVIRNMNETKVNA